MRRSRNVKIGDRIRELRHQRGLTQAEAARKIGISQVTNSNLELGKWEPGTTIFMKICQFYEQDPWVLAALLDDSIIHSPPTEAINRETVVRMLWAADRINALLDEIENIEKN